VRVAGNHADQICFALDAGRAASLCRWSTPARKRRRSCAPARYYSPRQPQQTPGCAASGASSRITANYLDTVKQRGRYRADDRDQPSRWRTSMPSPRSRGRRTADRPVPTFRSSWGCRSTTKCDTYQRSARDKIAATAPRSTASPPGCISILPRWTRISFVQKGFKFFTIPWGPWAKAGIQNGLAGIKR